MSAHTENETVTTIVGKTVAVWLAYIAGLSLGDWVQLAALAYTVLQIYILVRDKLWQKPKS